ncbi:hypothetical protein [Runella sp.]|uniref:hypothetical protein n=1 Tax=Runella sp. TaxID=1960881 RepID=UPI003D0A571F
MTQAQATPRRDIQLRVIRAGRVHPLPECRLNEYCALLDVEKYRKETLSQGNIGCFGGGWNGVDTATAWSHDIYQRGYVFKNFRLEDFATHAPFDVTGSGTQSYTSAETYWGAEKNAENYLIENFGSLNFSPYVSLANAYDVLNVRHGWA